MSNNSQKDDALDIMGISYKKTIGKVITAKNYVGIISMNDGTTIEILPKVFSSNEVSKSELKKLLIYMLKTLTNTPFKSIQTANINIEKMSIFEIFIRMFIDEILKITKRGLRYSYEAISNNEKFYKGKLKFSEHIKSNYAHKERSYVEYDFFSPNRAENKLIKSTLKYLHSKTISDKNKKDLQLLLNMFSEVELSSNYEIDFSKCVTDRNMQDYSAALEWCSVFLKGKSFTSFSGSQTAVALLFPMETLFEKYITYYVKKIASVTNYSVKTQDKSYHLFEIPKRKFLLKPDIVLKNKFNNERFVIDTKWKVLSINKPNFGISQADMYQMYAYHKKYSSQNITLIYPLTEKIAYDSDIQYSSVDGENIRVRFVDLFDIKPSLTAILLSNGIN